MPLLSQDLDIILIPNLAHGENLEKDIPAENGIMLQTSKLFSFFESHRPNTKVKR